MAVILNFDATQWQEILDSLEEGQSALSVALIDVNAKLNSIASLLAEMLIVLQQIRDA